MADSVAVIHFLFIVFAGVGALLALRWHRLVYLHLPALTWALWITFSNGICPLTPLENWLRGRAGQSGYEQGFIDHYLMPLIYPPGLTPTLQILVGVILLSANALAYGWLIRKMLARRRGADHG